MNPLAILGQALTRKLRPGEHLALTEHIAALERRLAGAERALEQYREPHTERLRSPHVELALAPSGALAVTFPGQHTITIPLPREGATRQTAFETLVRILQSRAGEARNTVATPGAPVQYDLSSLLKAVRVTKVPPKGSGNRTATLADINAISEELFND